MTFDLGHMVTNVLICFTMQVYGGWFYMEPYGGETINFSNTAKFYCIAKIINVHQHTIKHHPCAKFE